MSSSLLYFAYGSNLSYARLSQRVASARFVVTGTLPLHKLCFHKIGRDGSGKCDAYFTGIDTDCIFGAVYSINPEHKVLLDQAEGAGNGYEIKQVHIRIGQGNLTAFTYYATHINPAIKPFHWYKHHVLRGAEEHCFPKPYISKIHSIESVDDVDTTREDRERTIHKTVPKT